MSKGNTFENDLLALIFSGTAIAGLADNAASGALGSLYLGLHTADPGETGSQATSECNYTGYSRVAVSRPGGFTVVGGVATLAADADFARPTNATNLPQTVSHFSIGTAASGAGKILYSGPLDASLPITSTAIAPRLEAGTTVTED